MSWKTVQASHKSRFLQKILMRDKFISTISYKKKTETNDIS